MKLNIIIILSYKVLTKKVLKFNKYWNYFNQNKNTLEKCIFIFHTNYKNKFSFYMYLKF